MDYFKKALEIANSDTVQEGIKLPEVKLNKWLELGNTSYACRWGVLGDGHDHIHIADQYHQAHREFYSLSMAATSHKANAKRAEAKRIRAEAKLASATKADETLDAEADLEEAMAALASALYSLEDLKRQLSVYTQFIAENKSKVEAMYPEGYEQAQPDIWKTQMKYRVIVGESTKSIPLPAIEKALIAPGRPEAMAVTILENQALLEQAKDDTEFLSLVRDQKLVESK